MTQDAYAPSHENQPDSTRYRDPETADPTDPDCADRRDLSLIPPSVKTGELKDPFVEAGKPLTVGEARESYLKIEGSNFHSDKPNEKAKCEKELEKYWRIMEADRRLREQYDDRLTMGMITRRLSPLDQNGNWLTPWECDEMLHGGSVDKSLRDAWDYHLGDYTSEWVRVTAPTRSAGTPHEHILFWIDDGDNEIAVDHLSPALDKHLKYCPNAYEQDHQYRADGTDGAIRAEHSPTLRSEHPEKMAYLLIHSDAPPRKNTAGAQYLASQLSHVQMLDCFLPDEPDPVDPLIDGAVLAWISSHHWFRTSDGFPV